MLESYFLNTTKWVPEDDVIMVEEISDKAE